MIEAMENKAMSWRDIAVLRSLPFLSVHLGCFLVFWAGFSWTALAVCVGSYFIRMFGITAGFHRYFSHRSFKTSRWFQTVLAFIGTSSAQMGPLWWAANHRHHHRYSDQEPDYHSPGLKGFMWAHFGWVLCPAYAKTNYKRISDFARYPELRWMNDYYIVPPFIWALGILVLGFLLEFFAPALNTNGFQLLVWGFFISTVLLYHGTFCVNSICHTFGSRRFHTKDQSYNNWLIALLTLGEGWHNNHHRYSSSERQGFYWWEIDISHYILKGLSWIGLVWELRRPPEHIYQEAQLNESG